MIGVPSLEKRVQVFVSSTFVDLAIERQAVVQTLLKLNAFPAGMELFPASDEDKWDLIKGVIDDSDYYCLIVGGRYGSEDNGTQLSYTEMEYDYAQETSKPTMVFMHRDPDSIPHGMTDKDSVKEAKLAAFKDKVGRSRNAQFFESAHELSAHVAVSMTDMVRKRPAVGWVRGDAAMTPEVRSELAELRQKASAEVSRTATPVFPDLEDGEDRLSFSAEVGFTCTKDPDADTEDPDVETEKIAGSILPSVSWNELFSFVAPTLLHETSDRMLTEVLEDKLCEFISDTRPSLDDFPNIVTVWKAEVNQIDSVRDDVVVQFLALRLIERGVLKRGVNDKARYWKLSDVGEDRMMQLRARRKGAKARIDSGPEAAEEAFVEARLLSEPVLTPPPPSMAR